MDLSDPYSLLAEAHLGLVVRQEYTGKIAVDKLLAAKSDFIEYISLNEISNGKRTLHEDSEDLIRTAWDVARENDCITNEPSHWKITLSKRTFQVIRERRDLIQKKGTAG